MAAIMDTVIWEPLPDGISNGDRITFYSGNLVCSGRVFLTPKTIIVKMDLPKGGVFLGKRIPLIEPSIFTETTDANSLACEYGVRTAKELLVSLYSQIAT